MKSYIITFTTINNCNFWTNITAESKAEALKFAHNNWKDKIHKKIIEERIFRVK